MMTINRIGIEALKRIFAPQDDPMSEFSRTFEVGKAVFDLNRRSVVQPNHSRELCIKFNSGEDYMVWGIRLGLKELRNPSQTMFDEIVTLLDDTPSHVIVRVWSNSDFLGRQEAITVYRLSQEQQQAIQTFRSQNTALIRAAKSLRAS